MRALLIGFLLLTTPMVYSQQILITDPNYDQNSPLDCIIFNNGSVTNFFDDGGSGGNYSPNFSDTIVLCPDLTNGSKVSVTFATNAGYVFDVHSSDTIYVFDGPSVSAPLYGAHNSTTDPNGFSHQASFTNNPSGCITVVFVSNASDEGAGWQANVSCGNPPQPFSPHMRAFKNGIVGVDSLFPADTGNINVCFGDSVLYIGSADFPYALEQTGTGYSQNDTNVNYQWFFSNGQTAMGDSVWFKPPGQAGYVVTLQVTDQFPNAEQLVSFVRVNPRVDFSSTRALNDSICQGDSVVLLGGLTPNDTVGASPTIAITEVGGSFAGLTYLPDGSGSNYETQIEISGFGAGQTLQSGMDVLRLAMTIEHSFLGDLEMMLTCPNGDSIVVFNSFTGQGLGPAFAGGFGGGGTFLGDAFDNNIGNPGVGWTYSFSDSLADWGNMGDEFAAGNTLPTIISNGNGMNPDSIYLPEQSFEDLVGCPINGVWTLTVRDNLGIDDGYIFDWAIFFNPFINPNFESYSSTISDAAWYNGDSNSFPMIGGVGDTIVSILPDSIDGFSPYTFEVLDDFGCLSDTTIRVYTTSRPDPISIDTGTCENELTLTVTGSDSVQWSVLNDPAGATNFSPSATDTIVSLGSTQRSDYLVGVEMFHNNCRFDDSIWVRFYDAIPANLFNDTLGCFGDTFQIIPDTDELNAIYEWQPSGNTTRTLTVSSSGTYYLTVTGCNTVSDSIEVQFYRAPRIIAPNLICDSLDTLHLSKFTLGGSWRVLDDTEIIPDAINTVDLGDSFLLQTNQPGFVVVGYYDSLCASLDSTSVLFDGLPSGTLIDSVICLKDRPLQLVARPDRPGDYGITWSTGERDSIIQVMDSGRFTVQISNECGTRTLETNVKYLNCEYFTPNIITPNGDGINDVFNIKAYAYYDRIQLSIYNRWGALIFEGQGNTARWDGHLPNGERISQGTYFYVLQADDQVERGSVTVIYDE